MAKAYLQPSLFFDDARVGTLTVYVAGGTTKATLYNPTSGAPISNPVGIDADGYAASFMADTGMAFDLVAKDYLGATKATIPNVMAGRDANGVARNARSETSGAVSIPSNTLEVFGTVSAISFSLGTALSGVANLYCFQFTAGASTSVTWPAGILWVNGAIPTIVSGKKYQVSILELCAVLMEF